MSIFNPVAIIQARTGSSRLPNKVLAELANKNSMLYYVIQRCQQSRLTNKVVVATSVLQRDDPVEEIAKSIGVNVYRGSENDVLQRYLEAASQENADPIIRITGDCPLVDPAIIDQVLDCYFHESVDYVSNNISVHGFPRGMDCEVVSYSSLQRVMNETSEEDVHYREHATNYIYGHPELFKIFLLDPPDYFKRYDVRLCVDEETDLELVRYICEHFYPKEDFTLAEIIDFLDRNPEIAKLNRNVRQKSDDFSEFIQKEESNIIRKQSL